MVFISSTLAIVLWSTSSFTAASEGRQTPRVIEAAVASATVEWTAAFSQRGGVYVPPRVIVLDRPEGHPARGAGYSPGVGLILDRGDIDHLMDAFPDDGPSLVALLVAHEVGHHVQFLMGDDPLVQRAARERQADCLAGWWIARAQSRARGSGHPVPYSLGDLRTLLPEAVALLTRLQSGQPDAAAINAGSHGPLPERIAAFEAGMAATEPWTCLWGRAP